MHYNYDGKIKRIDILDRIDEIMGWIEANESLTFMQEKLKCNYETLRKVLLHFSIEYTGHKTQVREAFKKLPKNKISVYEYLGTGKYIKPSKLKHKLVEAGLKEDKCERCNNSTWLGKPIPLELHHINGNRFDNCLSNLQILCPNCHALTNNFKGKNNNILKPCIEDKAEIIKNERLQLMYNANIDYNKFGWITQVSKLFGITPQSTSRYIRKHFPSFYNKYK